MTTTTLTRDQLQALTEEHNAWMEVTGRKLFPPARQDELLEMGALRCNRCHRVKPVGDFNRDRSQRTGYEGRCRACNLAKCRTYKLDNLEKEQARWTRNYQENKEERQAYDKSRYWTSEHRRLHHQLLTGYQRAARAGNRAVQITPEQLQEHWRALQIDPYRCYLTGAALTPQNRSLDHVVPLGKGGAHAVFNLMPCSLEANRSKNVKPRI